MNNPNTKSIHTISQWDIAFAVLIPLSILIVNDPFSQVRVLTADACEYLNIATNFAHGKGFNISYNVHLSFLTPYFSAFAFKAPLFPFFAAMLIAFKGIAAVYFFNLLLSSINGLLFYAILRIKVQEWTAFLWTVFFTFSKSFIFAAFTPWSEQWHLCLILLATVLFLQSSGREFLIGGILALAFLTRAATIYNGAGFLIAVFFLHGINADSLRRC